MRLDRLITQVIEWKFSKRKPDVFLSLLDLERPYIPGPKFDWGPMGWELPEEEQDDGRV